MAAAAFCALWAPRSAAMPARSAMGVASMFRWRTSFVPSSVMPRATMLPATEMVSTARPSIEMRCAMAALSGSSTETMAVPECVTRRALIPA